MRTILAGLSLALLAACGGAATNANDSAANAAGPVSNATTPDTAAEKPANASAAADPARAGEIAECTQDVATELPAGTDVNAFCGCAVDGMQGGRGERAAMEACAVQMGIDTSNM